MRTLAFLALLAVGARAQQSGPPQTLSLPKQNGGLSTFYSANRLDPSQSPAVLNGYLDADSAVVKRNGYQIYGTVPGCTSPLAGGWSFTNSAGTFYTFVQCGNQMYVSGGNGSYSVIGSTLVTTYPTRAALFAGKIWFTDGADNLWNSDGVAVSSVTGAPIAQTIGVYQNRLVLGDIAGGNGFSGAQSEFWLSGFDNATDFTLPTVIVDTSAADILLNGPNDSRPITCTFDGFKDVLIFWNSGQMWGLYGTGNSSFVLRLISNEIGCTEQGAVQEYNGRLYWLSKRGIEAFDGTTVNLVSWPVQDQVQNLISIQKNAQANTQSGTTAWQAGNLSASGSGAPVSATVAPPDLVPSTWSVTENSGVQWGMGFLTNVSTTANPGYVTLVQGNAAAFINAGGESGDNTTNWYSTPFFTNYADSSMFGAHAFEQTGSWTCPVRLTFTITSGTSLAGPALVSSNVFITNGMGVTSLSLAPPSISTSVVRFNVMGLCTGSLCIRPTAYSVPFIAGSAMSIKYKDAGGCTPAFDIDESKMVTSGNYTSVRYDTAFSTPTWGDFNATVSSDVNSGVALGTQVSAAATGTTDAAVSATLGQKIGSAQKEFIAVTATFTVVATTDTAPTLSSESLAAATTGYWISQCIQPSGMSSWGTIQANTVANGGAFTFWLSTGTSCALVTNPVTANWTQQTLNTNITVATTSFVAERVKFFIDVATEVPHLQSVTLNWSGSGRPNLASTIYNKRYYLAYTTSTDAGAYNDHVLVFDTNNTWTQLDDIFASSLFTSNLKLYSGSSKKDGNVFLQDVGTVDNGSSFQFRLDTPDLDLGGFAAVKDLDDWWVEAQGTTQQANAAAVSVNYYVDGGTTPYSAGTFSSYAPERGYIFANGSFGLGGSPTKARTLRLQYLDTSASPLRIYQSLLRYWPESLP